MSGSVLINGAGIAGLACRLALLRSGVVSDVVDLAPALNKPEQDSPLILTSNATRVLHQLGLQDVVRRGQRLDQWTISDVAGKKLGGVDFGRLSHDGDAGGFPTVGMQSSELLSALTKASKGDNKAGSAQMFRMAAGVSQITQAEGGLRVTFTSQSVKPKTYGLVVGADGVASKVRELCIGPIGTSAHVRFPGWGLWSCVVPADVCSGLINDHGVAEIWGEGRRFGVFALPGGKACCYGTVNHDKPRQPIKQVTEVAKAFVSHFEGFSDAHDGAVGKILQHVQGGAAKSKIKFEYPAPVELLRAPPGNMPVALIGDAAHAVLPIIWQGPALALEDGYTLAQAVAGPENQLLSPEGLSKALTKWTKEREDKAGLVRNISSELGRAAAAHKDAVGMWGTMVNSLMTVAVHEKALEARMKLILR